jgi:hypothetical protein
MPDNKKRPRSPARSLSAPVPSPAPGSSGGRRKIALVSTTINVPGCLTGYVENAARHGYADDLTVIVVGDRKTPPETGNYLADLGRLHPGRITYMDVPGQQAFLRKWPAFDLVTRYNCIQRRNVGYLQAALQGAEVVISVDDDNFFTEDDFFAHHLAVGTEVTVPVVSHPSGWWNICERLATDPPRKFYHRGYPKSKMDWVPGQGVVETKTVKVMVNAGLWLKNPDVDATANIEEPINVVGMNDIAGDRRCALEKGTWCPFNSQNTAFDMQVLPAMYLVTMLDWVRGYRIGRLDDIWMAYFFRALGDPLGHHVLYGPPLVTQDRNPHDFVKDLAEELPGYILTEKLVRYLRDFKGGDPDYLEGYLDLCYFLRDKSEGDPNLERPEREYLRSMVLGMMAWQGAVKEIQKAGS